MHHRTKVGATLVIASLALLALTAPAGASMAKLKLVVGGVGIGGGAPVLGTSINATASSSIWSDACTESSLTGTVSQNFKSKGDAFVIPSGNFGGGGNEGLCASNLEFVTIFKPIQTPEISFAHNGKAKLRFPRLRLVPAANINKPEAQQEACAIAASTMRGTFPVTETPQPLVVTFTESKMKLESSSGPECGFGAEAKPRFSGSFTFTSRGTQIEAVLYHK
jgi:hypothetical protein